MRVMKSSSKRWAQFSGKATLFIFLLGAAVPALASDLVITGVVDGPLTGGVPKAVELFALADITDLSIYGIGSANNGGGSDGEEFTFPAVALSAGSYIYVASESAGFTSFFGFAPDYTSAAASINGDDAIELFMSGGVVDVFGDINVDGTGEPWEYTDGWAYRVDLTGPDGTTFVLANWTFSGPDALDGETTNGSAATPFPIGTYTDGGVGASDLVITGVVDGPLSGGVPKAIEFFVLGDVADLSIYGFGSANNGGGSDGEEFTFPAVAATAGDFIYVASEGVGFSSFFGFAPDYTSGAAAINGDDAIELFKSGAVVDVFGDIDVDGTGQPWEYTDGWAYRVDETGPDGSTFVLANWTFSGPDALDGETTNGGAATPFPIGTFNEPVVEPTALVISGVVDGPLSGGLPKAVEFFAFDDIADLSTYGFGSANNGGGSDGEEFTFPAVAVSAGSYIYVASESAGFTSFFGFAPDYTSSAANINGDDAIELFQNGTVVDVFGDINVDGTGQPWEYLDGWAYRVDDTGPDGSTFVLANWTFSGPNALDGESTNDTASVPFPIGTFSTGGLGGIPELLISGVIDGPLSGGLPKAVEFYAFGNISDLSAYGFGSANNGGGSDGEEFTFPAVSVSAGTFIFVASESTGFTTFFGFAPDYTSGAANINGDDAIELFKNGAVIDVFGDINVDGTGQPWEYLDGWAYRVSGTGPDGSTFVLANWTFSGPNALDGETSNDTAASPFPTNSYGEEFLFFAEIFEIQGAGSASPFVGSLVTTEDNVVTCLSTDGFFIQTPASRDDSDVDTSNGIFVFTGSAPTVSVGDLVDVTGRVAEFFGFTEIGSSPTVTVVGSDSVPAAILLGATVPSPDPTAPSCAIELECYEGMLVEIVDGAVTGPNQRFNPDPVAEVHITAAPSRTFREEGVEFPGLGMPPIPIWDGNPEVFELDPDKLGLPNQIIPAGSSFSAKGVIGFEFGGYELWPNELTVVEAPLPVPVRPREPFESTVGSLNLFRLFDDVDDPPSVNTVGDTRDDFVVPTAEYMRRLAKLAAYIVDVMDSPGILAVQEAEKLEVLEDLAVAVNALDGSVNYTAYLIEGNDVGTIDVGFLVRDNVQVTSVTQLGATELFTFDSPPSALHDRPPLLLEGICDGTFPISVMVLHMRSLGGIETTRTQQKRFEQAESVAQKVQDIQTADPDVNLVVIGDFNAFEFTDGYVDLAGIVKGDFDPAESLVCSFNACADLVEPDLVDEILGIDPADRYSFIFRGDAQVLDHAMTSDSLADLVNGLEFGRGNADAAVDLINDDGILEPANLPLRSSDHDGLVLYVFKDEDHDGVPDAQDVCLGTAIPEGVPTQSLGTNRWALVDDDTIFDTTPPSGNGPGLSFTIEDTAGCSCEQILEAQGLGDGHTKHGCSNGAMLNWVALVGGS